MSRALWSVAVPLNRQDAMMRQRVEFKVALPPQSELLDMRSLDQEPKLWFIGDMDEPCVDVPFLWLRTGQKIDTEYYFVGLLLVQGSSFGLFVAGQPQTSNKVRTP